jgi:hypothetical protein
MMWGWSRCKWCGEHYHASEGGCDCLEQYHCRCGRCDWRGGHPADEDTRCARCGTGAFVELPPRFRRRKARRDYPAAGIRAGQRYLEVFCRGFWPGGPWRRYSVKRRVPC